jgi:hypothetical protein
VSKLTLMSVVLALLTLPIIAASDPVPTRGLKRAIASVVAFNLFYMFLVRYVVPRLG